MNRPSISMLILAVLTSMAAASARAGDGQGQPVPKAVEALRGLQVSEHIPARGDSGSASWSTGAYVYDPSGNISAIGSSTFCTTRRDG